MILAQPPIERALSQYRGLMSNIRARFDIIDGLQLNAASEYAVLETAAFHLRKSIEGVAFGCLVATQVGLKSVPRDAQGQWNADRIFSTLKKREKPVFPFAITREEPAQDDRGIQHYIVPNVDWNITLDEAKNIYRRTHKWVHEWNPYVPTTVTKFGYYCQQLLDDIVNTWQWLVHHAIGVAGEVFIAVLKSPDIEGIEIAHASANTSLGLAK